MSIQSTVRFSLRTALGLLVAGACLTATSGIASADGVDPLDTNNSRTSDPFSEQTDDSYAPFFDMMHRVQLGNIRSASEYSKDQQNSLGSAASDFRTRQREALQQGQSSQLEPATPSAAPLQNSAVDQPTVNP